MGTGDLGEIAVNAGWRKRQAEFFWQISQKSTETRNANEQ